MEHSIGVPVSELQFYALSYLLACSAGLARTFRDTDYSSVWNLLSVGACSGFIGLVCVIGLCWYASGSAGHERGLAAIAILVGLLGKEADKLYPLLLSKVLKKFGFEDKE